MHSLPRETWQARRSAHVERLGPYARERLDRMKRGMKHPVHDFLFTYYPFRPAHLLRWSPGPGLLLKDVKPDETDWPVEFESCEDGCTLALFPEKRRDYLAWAIDYLERVTDRPPNTSCFGLHEWAMVYHAPEVRHAATPMRLKPAEIADVVDELGLRCTHFDAFRFFTLEAAPKNRIPLERRTTHLHDQPGCIHATMDLYKFAFKIAPWIASELLGDCFLLAWEARRIDMRASPYDLLEQGFEPIRVETREGREEYQRMQLALGEAARPLRMRLLESYRVLHLSPVITNA